jgi:hypothetical protein
LASTVNGATSRKQGVQENTCTDLVLAHFTEYGLEVVLSISGTLSIICTSGDSMGLLDESHY